MRGFVGFGVGEEFAEDLRAFAESIGPGAGLRLTHAADLHVTLKFLSEFSSVEFARCLPELAALGPPPDGFMRAGAVAIWPTVVALECEASAELVSWKEALNCLLERRGFIKERHPAYHPHVTLARIGSVAKGSRELADLVKERSRAFEGRRVPLEPPALWQSQAEETGRRHRPFLSPLFGA